MQSSSLVAFRALVMLSCLVAVPLAAVFGTSLPEVVRALLAGRLPGDSDPVDGPIGDASRFEPVMPGEMASIMPPNPMPPNPVPPNAMPPRPMPPGAVVNPRPAAVPSPTVEAGSRGPVGPTRGVVPVGYETPVFDSPTFPVAMQTPATPVAEPVDQFTYVQDRLKQLGANYYLLEMLEGREQGYRFHCCIPVGGNPSYTRKYEALDPSPLGAMIKVLQQVEARRTVGP